jgi:hypothetical protein
MTAVSELAWYVFAVLPATAELRSGGPALLRGADVILIGDDMPTDQSFADIDSTGLVALASLVPAGLFSAESAASQAHDPDWIAARAADHHAVVSHAAATAACLPLGFGTLFSSSDTLRAWLQSNAASLRRALSTVAGRQEWGVCLTEDAESHTAWLTRQDPVLAALARDTAAATPGTGYLLSRRLSRANEAARANHASKVATRIGNRLGEIFCLARLETASPSVSAKWSVLAQIGCHVVTKLSGLGEELENMGLHLRVDGPWPPYAFARAAWQDAQNV